MTSNVSVPVLVGQTFTSSSRTLAAQIAGALLRDLGAEWIESRQEPADLADLSLNTQRPSAEIELSSFGAVGRFRNGPRTEQAVFAVGGALAAQWSYRPGPVYVLTPFASVAQGILAAIALVARRLSVDPEHAGLRTHISALHALFALQAGGYGAIEGRAPDPARWSHTPRGQWPTYAMYQAGDGEWLFLCASVRPFMVRVLETLGLGHAIPDGEVRHAFQDVEPGTGIWQEIADVIATQPRDHWLRVFGEVNVPIAPVLSIEEAIAHEHVRGLGLIDDELNLRNLVQVERVSDAPVPRPSEGAAPLAGVRVLEVTGYIAGSYVGRLLADLGADVVKIEAPGGDPFRLGDATGPGLGFISWNYGKRGMSLDLASDEGRTRVGQLVDRADVFVTNYRSSSLERLGLSREAVLARNPGLIHCMISAFGEGGPLSNLQGFDPIAQSFVGLPRRQGGDSEPIKSQIPATDYLSAMLATLGIVSARTQQVQSGGGYAVSTSLLNGALLLASDAIAELRSGRSYSTGGRDYEGPDVLEGLHQAADGWLLVTVPDRAQPRYDATRTLLRAGISHLDVEAAIAELGRLGVRAVPCVLPDEVRTNEHCEENGLFFRLAQPEHGTVILPVPVLRSEPLTGPAPALGAEPSLADWDV